MLCWLVCFPPLFFESVTRTWDSFLFEKHICLHVCEIDSIVFHPDCTFLLWSLGSQTCDNFVLFGVSWGLFRNSRAVENIIETSRTSLEKCDFGWIDLQRTSSSR
jgi:hypothetical protein